MPRSLMSLRDVSDLQSTESDKFYIRPRLLGGLNVALAVQRNVAEGIAVNELDGPIEDADQALQNAEADLGADIATLGSIVLRD